MQTKHVFERVLKKKFRCSKFFLELTTSKTCPFSGVLSLVSCPRCKEVLVPTARARPSRMSLMLLRFPEKIRFSNFGLRVFANL